MSKKLTTTTTLNEMLQPQPVTKHLGLDQKWCTRCRYLQQNCKCPELDLHNPNCPRYKDLLSPTRDERGLPMICGHGYVGACPECYPCTCLDEDDE